MHFNSKSKNKSELKWQNRNKARIQHWGHRPVFTFMQFVMAFMGQVKWKSAFEHAHPVHAQSIIQGPVVQS